MKQERILIAEDESRVAQALSRALSLPEGGGFHVEAYGSGEEALTRLREEQFDLLITDLRMPGMNGFELLRKSRGVSPEISSILITAYGSSYVEEKANELGIDAYLPKPFSMRALVETVQNTIKQKKRGDADPQRLALADETRRAVQDRLDKLHDEIGAHSVLLHDQAGHLLAQSGERNEFDTNAFLALQSNAMATTRALAQVLGEPESFDLHLHDGKKYETYTARANDQVLLSVILDKQDSSSRTGMVWLYLRRAIADLGNLLSDSGATDDASQHAALRALEEALQQANQSPAPEPARNIPGNDQNTIINYEQAKALGLLDRDHS
jgi:CheY-like chemotaxis protein